MPLKTYTIQSEILATSSQCRLDSKYSIFTSVENWTIFPSSLPQEPLSKWIVELPIKKLKKWELDDEYFLVNISDQWQRSGTLEEVEEVTEVWSDKTMLNDCDIFVSKLWMPKGYIFLNTYKWKNIIGSTEFIPYVVQEGISPLLVKYILLHPNSLNAYASLESGKTPSHKRVNPSEFLKIKIPKIPLPLQNSIVAEIEPIEEQIAELKSQIVPSSDIINRVFAREFGFDLRKFEEVKNDRFFFSDLSIFGKQNDIRFSVKHSRYSQYLNELKLQYPFIQFQDILLENPQYWANESGKDYEEWDPRYIRITDIDDIWNLMDVDKKSAEKSDEKYLLKNNDFLFARSGNTVWKSFLYNSEIHPEAIFAWYFIKFVFDTEIINPLFLLYYSKSLIFEAWKNSVMRTMWQPNINAEEYKTLPILNISLTKQQRIVDEIRAELDAQKVTEETIASERMKIDVIIERAINQ